MIKKNMQIRRMFFKIRRLFLSIGKLLIESTSGNRKRKLLQYIAYFIIIIIINVLVGKNIGNTKYPWYSNVSIFLLVNINIILLLVLLLVIFRNLAKVLSESHSNIFGSRLKIKLVIFSIVLTVMPVSVIFFLASTLINDSINKWFNNQVDRAMSGSISLMEYYKNLMRSEVFEITEFISKTVGENSRLNNINENSIKDFSRLISNNIVGGISVFDRKGRNIFLEEFSPIQYLPMISQKHKDTVLKGHSEAGHEFFGNIQLYWTGLPVEVNGRIIGATFVYKIIPEKIADNVDVIQDARNKYRESEFFSYPVKKSYFMLLVMMSLFVIFAGIWGSIFFARNITKPIEALADASVEISRGNLDVEVKAQGGDEISYLIRTFNRMTKLINANTRELHSKNEALSAMYNQISRDNMYIDAIFKNVDSALILLSHDMQLLKTNAKADGLIGDNKEFDAIIKENINVFATSNENEFFKNIELVINEEKSIYSLNFSKITTDENEQQMLIVIEDITDIVDAQRISLWKEVATRIAHEVKNPLTPIKLVAERVKKRSLELKDTDVKDLIQESMTTVITETDHLLELVEEFNMFARLPKAKKYPIEIISLVDGVLSLYYDTYPNIHFYSNIQEDLVIEGDRHQLRRVLQNLIGNSIFAMNLSGNINIDAYKTEENNIEIKIADTGSGIKQEDIPKIFEPYFSKRSGGTGLGLAIVKKIIEEHSGSIFVESSPKGTIFTITLPRGN